MDNREDLGALTGPRASTEPEDVSSGFDPARMAELYSNPTARTAVARCLVLIRERREEYRDPAYCTDQPSCSFTERFVCDQMATMLENEFALGTMEQCNLLGLPTPFERYRAAGLQGIAQKGPDLG